MKDVSGIEMKQIGRGASETAPVCREVSHRAVAWRGPVVDTGVPGGPAVVLLSYIGEKKTMRERGCVHYQSGNCHVFSSHTALAVF